MKNTIIITISYLKNYKDYKLVLSLNKNLIPTSPSFLWADSERRTAELTLAHNKRGRVV